MNFTIDRDVLLEKLTIINHGLPSKTPMKVLECIKIEVTDQDVYLTSSNSDIAIEVLVKDSSLVIQEPGRTVVPGKLFIDLVKAFDSKKVTIFLIEDRSLMLKADRKEYMINIMDVSDYPNPKFGTLENPFSLPAFLVKQLIDETIFACSNINRSPMLLGVNFKLTSNVLKATSTNSYRLSQKIINIENYNDFEVTIPAKSLDELEKCLDSYDPKGNVDLYFTEGKLVFKFQNVMFLTNLLDGNFPDTSSIIPESNPITVRFNKDELLQALNRISILSPAEKVTDREISFNAIKLKIDKTNEVELSSANNQGAGKEIVVPTDININEPLVIGFSSKYLTEALKVIPSTEVELGFKNSMKQFTIKGVDYPSLVELVLPFRLDE